MAHFVIGADGGGTKTELVLIDSSGNLIAKERVGSTNYQAVGGPRVKQELMAGFSKLVKKSNIQMNKISHAFLGLAGAGRKSDQNEILSLFRDTEVSDKLSIESDAIVALAGAFGTEPGIIIISGTGAICFGKNKQGKVVRSGGWGYLLGDEGSGYYIGRSAIIAALKNFDGRGEKTELLQRISRHFNLNTIDEIIPQIYQNKIDRIKIADLAPIVFEAANHGDTISEEIVKKAGRELGILAKAVAEKLNITGDEIKVGLIGSIFKQKELLINHIAKELYEVSWNVSISEPMFAPSIGAALLALLKLKVNIDESFITSLQNSISNYVEHY